MSITQKQIGDRRSAEMPSAASVAIGGDVLTSTPASPRVKIPRTRAWSRNDAAPARRGSIEPLPKEARGRRRISTPSRRSRAG